MFNLIKTAALATLIGIGTLGAGAASANASSLHIGVGGNGVHVGIGIGDVGYRHGGYRQGYRHGYRHAACTPHRAVEKARHMGVRHARVAHVGPRTIQVRGHRYGHPTRLTFARAPHCPVVRY